MTKVWCLVGLPGAGKTYWGEWMVSQAQQAHLIDDPQGLDLPPNGQYSDIVICDPWFCLTETRVRAAITLSGYDEVNWFYFENNPTQCLNNIRYRNDKRKVVGLIRYLSAKYKIPPDATTIPVWKP